MAQLVNHYYVVLRLDRNGNEIKNRKGELIVDLYLDRNLSCLVESGITYSRAFKIANRDHRGLIEITMKGKR